MTEAIALDETYRENKKQPSFVERRSTTESKMAGTRAGAEVVVALSTKCHKLSLPMTFCAVFKLSMLENESGPY